MDLRTPPDLDPRQAAVVGYVQHDGNQAVVGATAIGLPVASE
ncbi:hypothetical protein [Micromonospora sp. NPDC050695]